ncbi:hypothetical protein RB213_001156 [Colletotrichum asianum]
MKECNLARPIPSPKLLHPTGTRLEPFSAPTACLSPRDAHGFLAQNEDDDSPTSIAMDAIRSKPACARPPRSRT